MAWVAVHKNGEESIFEDKPSRLDRYWSDLHWIDDQYYDSDILLPKGTIEKLIGRKLSWKDEPVELT